jgi:DNA-binding winged helix-turn-helix (wHTH) protein
LRYKINGFLLSVELDAAVKGKEKIDITHQEKEALKLFFSSDDGFVDAQTLEVVVWGERVVTVNSLRKLISGLRLKFNDKESFQNVRGRGYQLAFDVADIPLGKNDSKKYPKVLLNTVIIAFILTSVTLFYSLFNNKQNYSLPKVSTQTVFESNDYILDYATYDGALYVTARNKGHSKLYKTLNRQNTALLSADYSGAFRGIEINSNGMTLLHVVEDSKCKIKIFKRPVEVQIDEIACNRQNAFPSFEWIDDTKFYITFNVSQDSSIRPFIYDLKTKRLEQVIDTNFDSKNGKKFIDGFIKAHDDGIFSLRINHLDQTSLMYFKDDDRRILYQFRSNPYSIAVSQKHLFFVGNNNELFDINLTDNIFSQNITPSLLLAPQTTPIDDPLILQNELYFSLGNTFKKAIYSISGNFTYSLENDVSDFIYTDKVLSILALTNSGYVVEQLKEGVVFNTIYVDTNLKFRNLAFHQGQIYLAGASGIYKLVDKEPSFISELKIVELVTNGKCMIAEAENGIFKFETDSNTFEKIAAQGERAFSSKNGCLFVDNLSDSIVNEKREKVAKPTMKKLLFEHQGKIAHWYSEGEKTNIVDLETGEIIAKTKNRALNKRVVSYENDILYLSQADVKTSIVKVKLP